MNNETLHKLHNSGVEVYFYGDCVRNAILKIPTNKYTIALIGGTKEKIIESLKAYEVLDIRTSFIITEGADTYEFTLFKSIKDLPVRPFTIQNAILKLDGALMHGEDILAKEIRVINKDIFFDYPEEMIRACRLASQLDFKIVVDTWAAIRDNNRLIKLVIRFKPQIIGQELEKILATPKPSVGFRYLQSTELLRYIIPPLASCEQIIQTRRGDTTNVFEHTMLAVDASENIPLIRWTVLFHDSGKPQTMEIEEDGKLHFFKHEIVGSKLAEEYMGKYKCEFGIIRDTSLLITHHMFDADPKLTIKGVRRLIKRVGPEQIFNLLKVREADRMGSTEIPSMKKIELLRSKIEKELKGTV